jgi:2-polyprenyl-3-methyl-5-hydroxy-6-metoxy-1,4-benzoquinol methylase
MPFSETHGQWEALASFWIQRCQEGEPNREGMLDRWMLATLGGVAGMRIVDLGCGEGRFCRMLSRQGASYVLGIDLCERLIKEAIAQKTSSAEHYQIGNAETLNSVEDQSFDIAVSYVSLVDIADLDAVIASSYRVLQPGGRFVVCNLAPMATAQNARITDPDGTRTASRVDHYFDESTRASRILGHELTNYHRTLSTYINGFLRAGYVLQGIYEPRPEQVDLARYPELTNELRAPGFVIYDLLKPVSESSQVGTVRR